MSNNNLNDKSLICFTPPLETNNNSIHYCSPKNASLKSITTPTNPNINNNYNYIDIQNIRKRKFDSQSYYNDIINFEKKFNMYNSDNDTINEKIECFDDKKLKEFASESFNLLLKIKKENFFLDIPKISSGESIDTRTNTTSENSKNDVETKHNFENKIKKNTKNKKNKKNKKNNSTNKENININIDELINTTIGDYVIKNNIDYGNLKNTYLSINLKNKNKYAITVIFIPEFLLCHSNYKILLLSLNKLTQIN
jgi:hypothetical protein